MYTHVEELIAGHLQASSRLAFYEGWQPDLIYQDICAFANDLYRTGGGHIVVGVETADDNPVRPVKGLDKETIALIKKDMAKYTKRIDPVYSPQIFTEKADHRLLLVIWVPSGSDAPYHVSKKISDETDEYIHCLVRDNALTRLATPDEMDELEGADGDQDDDGSEMTVTSYGPGYHARINIGGNAVHMVNCGGTVIYNHCGGTDLLMRLLDKYLLTRKELPRGNKE